MTERSPEEDPINFLPTYETGNGAVYFVVEKGDRARDVLATLNLLKPPSVSLGNRLRAMLAFAANKLGILENYTLDLEETSIAITDEVRVKRKLSFGPNAKYDDLQQALSHVYGEESPAVEVTILSRLIDEGAFEGRRIVSDLNEFYSATPESVVDELKFLEMTEPLRSELE